jgi:hypothetical protein
MDILPNSRVMAEKLNNRRKAALPGVSADPSLARRAVVSDQAALPGISADPSLARRAAASDQSRQSSVRSGI